MQKFLHVGCGPFKKNQTTKGFNNEKWKEIRLDIDKEYSPDILGTIKDLSSIENNSIDAIYSSHNIEHLYYYDVPKAFKEFVRVLNADGFAIITCPDLKTIAKLLIEDRLLETAYTSSAGPVAAFDMIFGHRKNINQDNQYMSHHTGFTKKTITDELIANGFKAVASLSIKENYVLWIVASKSKRNENEMKNLAKEHFPPPSKKIK
tara:strand:+ start:38 stop:655 length:618 start_codon:yes stop_codon:yes gene_type:complete